MIRASFIPTFAAAFGLLVVGFFAVTLTVDAYGVFPLSVSLPHLNRYKPQRIDIDRSVKPYEVWRYQPKTILMGTSRVQQGFDPAVFDGTRYAPAYNASIPASTVELNLQNLRQFLALDKNVRTVFLELFFYQFLKSETGSFLDRRTETVGILEAVARLFLSADALEAAAKTVHYNYYVNRPAQKIGPGGQFYYPPGHNSKGGFDGFPAGIWLLQQTRPSMEFDENAFSALSKIISLCRDRGVELVLVLTPNHVYDDYYIGAVSMWDKMQAWLERVSAMAPIVSFSQPGRETSEPVAVDMAFWNDPYHFKLKLGRMIAESLMGRSPAGVERDFQIVLTPKNVAEYIEERRVFAEQWGQKHLSFVEAFNREKQKWFALQRGKAKKH